MHIKRIRLKNFRGCSSLDLELEQGRETLAGWTVLAGQNGTGKSTILEGIASTVVGSTNVLVMLERPDWLIQQGEKEANSEVWVVGHEQDWRGEDGQEGDFKLEVRWSRERGPKEVVPEGRFDFVERQFWGGAAFGAKPEGWFFAAYGSTRISAPATSSAEALMQGPARKAAVVTLFRRDASLREVLRGAVGIPTHNMPKPEVLSYAHFRIADLLGFGKDSATWGNQRVSFFKSGVELELSEFGQGFESLALLIVNILYQLHEFYGPETFKNLPYVGPISLPGVILIDEIENHLHPQLQQSVGFWLKKTFPNIQFIVTTHSPFICQAADVLLKVTDNAQITPITGETRKQIINGSIDDAVLTELFGLPSSWSPQADALRNELAKLELKALDQGTVTPEEAARMRELAALLPGDATSQLERVLAAIQRAA